jgi:ATP-dependent protease ClpP protease subunit
MPANELVLYGTVGASFWDEEYFTASQVRRQLGQMKGPISVRINSGGGVATEGQSIYTMLRDYPGEVTVVVDGVAASAASLIAMAGDRIVVRLGAFLLIHDPAQMFTEGRGTEDDHRAVADILSVVGDAYADVYASRAGLSRDEARAIMRAETVMDGAAAVEMGFADEAESVVAQPAAAFDYRIYANAPQELREASERLGERPGREAVMAMVAGAPRNNKGKPTMADDKTKAAEGDSAIIMKADAPKPPAPAPAPAPDLAAIRADAQAAERQRIAMIQQSAMMAGLEMSATTDMIQRGLSFEEAQREIVAAWQAKGGDDLPRAGVSTNRITRDEGETRRVAMASAIAAQMGRGAPDHEAGRAYMGHSIVDMMVDATGYRGATRTGFDRQRVIEAAFHTTSDFPAVFENALNKRLQAAYAMAQPVYSQIAARMDFVDFRPHPITGVGTFPLLTAINEGGEITFGTLGDKKETVSLVAYAKGLRLTRQMIVNDDLGAIERIVQSTGLAVARTEEAVFFATMLGGANADGPTLTETTRQVFNTTDGTKAGTAAAITVASVGLGRAAIKKHKGINAEDLDLTPSILLTGPDKQTEAEQLVADIQPHVSTSVNPFSGRLSPIATPKITGNAWYLLTAPAVQAQFMYGFLAGDDGPRVRMDEPFGQQGVAYTVERDFGCGAVDFRGAYKNAGA